MEDRELINKYKKGIKIVKMVGMAKSICCKPENYVIKMLWHWQKKCIMYNKSKYSKWWLL